MLIFIQTINFVIFTFCFSFFIAPQESLIPTNTNAAADQKRVSTLAKIPEEYSPVFGFIDGNVCCRVIPTVSMFEIHIYNNNNNNSVLNILQFILYAQFAHVPHILHRNEYETHIRLWTDSNTDLIYNRYICTIFNSGRILNFILIVSDDIGY